MIRSTESQRPASDDLLFDRFGVLEELGSGGFGTVVRAFDTVTGHEVALKLLHRGDQDGTQRFKREFRALVELEHPNLVRLGELFERNKTWAFSMELVRGEAFLAWLRASGPHSRLDEQRLRVGFSQLVTAVEVLHRGGLLHRDIKPANVRVTPEGRVVLLDFGLVTDFASGNHSTTRNIVGTIEYMAPEQCESLPSTPAADMYSLGVLLYEALTERLPFTGDMRQILLAKYGQTPVPPRIWKNSLPEDLSDLCSALLALDPRERPCAADVLARLGGPIGVDHRVPVAPREHAFVGREHELRTLAFAFEAAAQSAPRLLLIEGESGIGKSALIAEFGRQLRAQVPSIELLSGRCHAFEHVSYKAFDEVVEQLIRLLRARPEEQQRLPESSGLLPLLFPALARVGNVGARVRTLRAERTELFDAFRDLLAMLCADGPLVVTIDDLQWSDPESVALLKDLLDFGELRNLLLVGSCRPLESDAQAALQPLLAHAQTTRVALDLLPRKDAAALLSSILPRGSSLDELAALLDESRGHPMFLRELAQRDGSHGRATLDDAIKERVQALDKTVREVLAHICVCASPLPHGLLADALGVELGLLYRALATLRTKSLVRSEQHGEVVAYHDRVREAVEHLIPASERARIHRGLARAWACSQHPVPARVAHHMLQCGDEAEAAPWLVRAAADALQVAAFERAAELYAQRLSLRSAALAGDERRELLRAQASALAQAGRCAESARALEALLDSSVGEARRELLVRVAQQLLQAGELASGLEVARTVVREMDLPWADTQVGVLLRLGVQRALARLPRAWPEPRRTALDEIRLDTIARLLQPLFWADLLHCADLSARYERLAFRCGSAAHIARSLGAASVFRTMQNPDDDSIPLSVQAELWVERDGTAPVRAYHALTRGGSLVFTARFGEARNHFERAEELYTTCHGEAWMETNSRGPHLGAMFLAGQHRAFVARSAHWLREANGRGDAFGAAQLSLVGRGASRHMIADDPERALAEIEHVMRPWRVGRFGLHHFFEADVLHHTLSYADASSADAWWNENLPSLRTLSRRLRGFIPDMLTTYRCEALLRHALAVDDRSLYDDVYRRALRIERLRTPRARARGSLLRAQAAARRGDHDEARAAAERAASQLEQQGEFRAQAGRLLLAALDGAARRTSAERELTEWLRNAGWKNPARAMAWMLPVLPALP